MYIEQLSARSRTIPRLLVDTAGKNAQSGSSRGSVDPQSDRGVAAGGVTASKSMGRCPIPAFPGDLERGYEETIPPRACGRVNTEHFTVGQQSYGVDLDPFENLAQRQSLGLSEQTPTLDSLSLHDSSGS